MPIIRLFQIKKGSLRATIGLVGRAAAAGGTRAWFSVSAARSSRAQQTDGAAALDAVINGAGRNVPHTSRPNPTDVSADDVAILRDTIARINAEGMDERLAALTRILKTEHMRDASTLGGDDASVALPLYATASNRSLLHQVTSLVEGLAAGGYKDKNGTTCSLLVGPAGSGKTNLLLGYLRACPILHPSVIPIYIGCDVLLHTGSSLAKTSLQGLMVAAAESHGVKVDRPQDLAGSLKRAGKQMLIVLDHMDQLYRCPLSEKELLHNVNATLGTVRHLGRQTSGCFSTILCSSETCTPQLQLLYADVGHLDEHLPMEAKGIPDPSRTQFVPLLSQLRSAPTWLRWSGSCSIRLPRMRSFLRPLTGVG